MADRIPDLTNRELRTADFGLAARLKMLMNDIIDVAYKGKYNNSKIYQFKNFNIYCTTSEKKSYLGYCRANKDGSCTVRIMGIGNERYQESLIICIHEVSHHIEYSIYGAMGHGKEFYQIHKELLFAAFDMGILKVQDLTTEMESKARNKNKLARMMDEYIPKPVAYKKDMIHVLVYNCIDIKDELKRSGYHWNKQDLSWMKTIKINDKEDEMRYLKDLGMQECDIKFHDGRTVITKLWRIVRVFGVPYEANHMIKAYGYRFSYGTEKLGKHWYKQIHGNDIDNEERTRIQAVSEKIQIVICYK